MFFETELWHINKYSLYKDYNFKVDCLFHLFGTCHGLRIFQFSYCIFISKPTKDVDSEKDYLLDEEEEQRQEEIRVKLERKRFKQDQKLVSTTLRSGNLILKVNHVLLILSTGIR